MRFTHADMWQIFQRYSARELSEGELRAALRCWPLSALEARITDLGLTVGHEEVAVFVNASDLPLRRSNRGRWRINARDARLDEFPPE